jgi:hypothetical protein
LMMEHQSNVVGSAAAAAAAFIQTLPAWNSQRNRPKSLPSFSDSSCGPTRQIPVNLQTWQNLDTHSQLVQKNKSKNKKKDKMCQKAFPNIDRYRYTEKNCRGKMKECQKERNGIE